MFNVNKVLLHDLHQLVLIYGRELDFLKSCYISMNSLYKSFCSMNVCEMSLRLFRVFNSIATIFPAFISHAAIRLRDWQWSINQFTKREVNSYDYIQLYLQVKQFSNVPTTYTRPDDPSSLLCQSIRLWLVWPWYPVSYLCPLTLEFSSLQ